MQEILRHTVRLALVSALLAGLAFAAPQSQDPPSQDPSKTPAPAQQQTLPCRTHTGKSRDHDAGELTLPGAEDPGAVQ